MNFIKDIGKMNDISLDMNLKIENTLENLLSLQLVHNNVSYINFVKLYWKYSELSESLKDRLFLAQIGNKIKFKHE